MHIISILTENFDNKFNKSNLSSSKTQYRVPSEYEVLSLTDSNHDHEQIFKIIKSFQILSFKIRRVDSQIESDVLKLVQSHHETNLRL